MSTLQHDRKIGRELRLIALPDIYGAIAQAAAKRKDASYADFLEEVLRAERDARRVRARDADSDDRLPSAEDARGLRHLPPALRVRKYRSSLAFVVQILCSSRRVVLRNDAYDAQRGSIVQIPSQNPKMGRRRIGELGINDYDVGSRNLQFHTKAY